MLVVTTDHLDGWDVQRVCGEVYGTVVRRAGVVTNPAGIERMLTESRTEAIARMLEHVRQKGGNAVTGLRFSTAPIGSDGTNEVCAYGTAVVAIPVADGASQTAALLGYGQPARPT